MGEIPTGGECIVAGCGKKYYALGYCKFHYGRQYYGRPLIAPDLRGEQGRRFMARKRAMYDLPDDIKEAYNKL